MTTLCTFTGALWVPVCLSTTLFYSGYHFGHHYGRITERAERAERTDTRPIPPPVQEIKRS